MLAHFYDKTRQYIKKQRHHFADKSLHSQIYGFPSSHVQIWELDHKEGWVLKNRCFWIVVVEKTFESPLDSKEIKLVNPKGNQPEYSLGGLMLKLQYPDAGKDCGQEKRASEDEMVGWHHWLNEPESEQTPGDSEGRGNLGRYSLWGCKESDTT